MRARMTWYPVEDGKAKSAIIQVNPDELATLRSALALPREALVRATAKIRTYNSEGAIVALVYPLRKVSGIKPFKPRPARQTQSCERHADADGE